jgi:hypothetical protein
VPALYRQDEGISIDWEESWRIRRAHLLAPQGPHYAFLERANRAWILDHAAERMLVLHAEGDRLVAHPANGGGENELRIPLTRDWISFDDHVGLRYILFDKHVPSNWGKTWTPENGYQFTPTNVMFQRHYYPGGCVIYGFSQAERREIPAESDAACPLLSGDSDSLGSLESTTYSITERRVEISSTSRGVFAVDTSAIGPGFVILEGISVARRRLLMKRESSWLLNVKAPDLEARGFSHEYSELNFEGQIMWRLPRVGDADDGRLLADSTGWIWWQSAAGEHGCCGLEWNLCCGPGTHRVARGRYIISVSLHPTGELIAVSVSDRHNTGAVRDAVYVIRSRDGGEVFRRYLPPLTKSRVQFLGSSFLAYTEVDGSDGLVRVVKVPPSVIHSVSR